MTNTSPDRDPGLQLSTEALRRDEVVNGITGLFSAANHMFPSYHQNAAPVDPVNYNIQYPGMQQQGRVSGLINRIVQEQ
jgi:arginine/lysine/ornithine decarboxylase